MGRVYCQQRELLLKRYCIKWSFFFYFLSTKEYKAFERMQSLARNPNFEKKKQLTKYLGWFRHCFVFDHQSFVWHEFCIKMAHFKVVILIWWYISIVMPTLLKSLTIISINRSIESLNEVNAYLCGRSSRLWIISDWYSVVFQTSDLRALLNNLKICAKLLPTLL